MDSNTPVKTGRTTWTRGRENALPCITPLLMRHPDPQGSALTWGFLALKVGLELTTFGSRLNLRNGRN